MLIEVKTLLSTGVGYPTIEEFQNAQSIARKNDCAVKIVFKPTFSYPVKEVLIEKDTDLELLHRLILEY